MDQSIYLLLDSKGNPIARGRIQGSTGGPFWQIQVEDGKIDEILEHKRLKLLSITDSGPSYEGTIVRSRNDMIQLEVAKLDQDAGDMRKNLRVAVRFKSLIYPLSGSWTGRRPVESNDLSCGGVAFFCAQPLEEGEVVEMVVPITSEPLILKCQVLRRRPSDREHEALYAAKFVEMCDDEEMIVREAVFSVQVRSRAR